MQSPRAPVPDRARSGGPRRARAVAAPIPDRLRHVRPEDVVAAGQIGERPRHAQDPMHRARRELQQVDRVLEHRLVVRRESADGLGLRLIEAGVEPARTPQLGCAGADDAAADRLAGFARWRVGTQFGRRQARDVEVQVDAFEQRAGDLGAIALDRIGVAAAAA